MDEYTVFGIMSGVWIISLIHVYKAGVKYGAEKVLDELEENGYIILEEDEEE